MNYLNLPKRGMPVDEMRRRLRGFRAALAQTTRLLAAWASDTPELEVKIMLGDHVYRDAIAVDALNGRLAEVGVAAEVEVEDIDPTTLRDVCGLARAAGTLPRLYGMYRVLKPRLLADLRTYLGKAHPVADGPSVRLLRSIVDDLDAELAWASSLFDSVGAMFHSDRADADIEAEWRAASESASGDSEPRLPPPEMRRDARFTFADEPFNTRDPTNVGSSLHRMLMSIEIPTIEVCGRNIADFPAMPWEFVVDMARQSWDESRHALLCYERITQLGCRIGQFPINAHLWKLSHGLPLEMRLAVHQRLGEWVGVDGATDGSAQLCAMGDIVSARAMAYVAVDEVSHVRGGNKWIRRIVGDAGVARVHDAAVRWRDDAGQTVRGFSKLSFNRELCSQCGFTQSEIDALALLRSSPPDTGDHERAHAQ